METINWTDVIIGVVGIAFSSIILPLIRSQQAKAAEAMETAQNARINRLWGYGMRAAEKIDTILKTAPAGIDPAVLFRNAVNDLAREGAKEYVDTLLRSGVPAELHVEKMKSFIEGAKAAPAIVDAVPALVKQLRPGV